MTTPKEKIVQTYATSLVLDSAYSQYEIQWSRLLTMQQNGSTILGISAIAFSLIAAMSTVSSETLNNFTNIQQVAFDFCFAFSLVYLAILGIYLYKLIRPKKIKVLGFPADLNSNIVPIAVNTLNSSGCENTANAMCTDYFLNVLNQSIMDMEVVLNSNQKLYGKALISGGFSTLCSIISFLTIFLHQIQTTNFIDAVLVVICFLSAIGVFVILTNKIE